jgi:putative phosphoesterase
VIWVVSDTHLTGNQVLPESFKSRVSREDIILHLGDLVSLEALEQFRSLCQFEAVRGNCDMPDVRRRLNPTTIIEIQGIKIGLVHGHGGPSETLGSVRKEFDGKVEIALFGHTHVPYQKRENGILYFNPGSLGNGRGKGSTYGVLHLDNQPWGEVVET